MKEKMKVKKKKKLCSISNVADLQRYQWRFHCCKFATLLMEDFFYFLIILFDFRFFFVFLPIINIHFITTIINKYYT
jgi:hypothetical protein